MSVPFKDDVTQVLSQDAFSLSLPEIGRVDGVQLAANSPCEDRFNRADSITLWEGERWITATVFDGHIGWQAADHLEKHLINAVQSKLEELHPDSRTDDKIQVVIKQAFTGLDSAMINDFITCTNDKTLAFEKKVRYMEVAWSGSCALLMLYNPATKTVYTACTGDSRVVLGQQKLDALWSYEALSKDQDGENEAEIARIKQAHPGEEAAVRDSEVLGLSVTRAFGDFRWKSSYDMQFEFGRRFMSGGPMAKEEIPTPPCLIATPVVTVKKIATELPSFLVIASDGLWQKCESWEVVDLVARWLEA